jgi:hypothetical protein
MVVHKIPSGNRVKGSNLMTNLDAAYKKGSNDRTFPINTPDAIAWHQIAFPLILLSVLLFRSIALDVLYGIPDLEDDSFYYVVIAKNIAEFGLSTFDGVTLTNGYHPLWTAMLAAWIYLFGDAVLPIKFLEAFILSAALYYLIRLIQPSTFLNNAIAFGCFYYAVNASSYMGMETTILFLTYTSLIVVLFSNTPFAVKYRGVTAGAIGALCIAARIDAAVFIIPILLLALSSKQERLSSLGIIGVLGACYAGVNLIIFGAAVPISGEIKSVGGFHLNDMFITQLREEGLKGVLTGNYITVVLSYIAAMIVLLSPLVRTKTKLIIVALEVGFLIFTIKLLFFSSWRIWEWYRFPIYFIAVPGLMAVQDILRQPAWHNENRVSGSRRIDGRNIVLMTVAVVMAIVWPMYKTLRVFSYDQRLNFYDVNQLVASNYKDVFGNSLVAMGDRAGSFAYYRAGRVFQLEGLVNDKAYSEMLRTSSDATGYLCRHNVGFLVDYEADLGNYENHQVKIFRSTLTNFKGPTIQVNRESEVGRYVNLDLYNNSASDEGDSYIYIWRLDCK